MPSYPQVAIIGVGLIGGSIGLGLKQRGLADKIIGVGRRQESLDRALACGAIDNATLELEAGVSNADVVIVATPVARVTEDIRQVLKLAPTSAWVTDVASTKASICAAFEADPSESDRFVGSHPLAGDHRSGPEHARADLFVNKTVVLTPTTSTPAAIVTLAQAFWEAIGARVVQMPPADHDSALATTSHLPHLIASALAFNTPEKWLPLAATGWADTTRIAAADPDLWTQIFLDNQTDVVATLDNLILQLQSIRSDLATADNDAILKFLQQAKRTRDALGN